MGLWLWNKTADALGWLVLVILLILAVFCFGYGGWSYIRLIGTENLMAFGIKYAIVESVVLAGIILGLVMAIRNRWFEAIGFVGTVSAIPALYITAFGIYSIESDYIFHFNSNAKLLNVLLLYPLAGAFAAIVIWLICVVVIGVAVFGSVRVSANGPTIPPIAIGYLVALAMGIGSLEWIDTYSTQILGVSDTTGQLTLLVVITLFLGFIILPNLKGLSRYSFQSTSPVGRALSALTYCARCLLSVADAVMADGLGRIASIPLLYLRFTVITLIYLVPILIVWFAPTSLSVPFGHWSLNLDWTIWILAFPLLFTLAVYRRTAWQEDYRQRSIISTRFQPRTFNWLTPKLNDDLNDELLYCVLLTAIGLIPTTLSVLSRQYELFKFADNFHPSFFDWLTFIGVELVRDFPFLEDLRSLSHAKDLSSFEPTALGEQVVFIVRVIVDVSVLAILFQSFTRSSSDALQKEQFQDKRSPVDRLDPIEERELFQKAEKDWNIVLHMPAYNNHRLEAMVYRANTRVPSEEISSVIGAARIAGFQLNGDAIARILFSRGDRDEGEENANRIRDDFNGRNHFHYPRPMTKSLRMSAAAALLEGLLKKANQLETLAPKTDLVQAALLTVDAVTTVPRTPELSAELDGISRAGQIELLLRELESDDWMRSNEAREQLRRFVDIGDAPIYRNMIANGNYRVRFTAISLLSVLPPDLENETAILNTAEFRRVNRSALHGLARIGGRATFEMLKANPVFTPEVNLRDAFDAQEISACLVSIALRDLTLREKIGSFFEGATSALHNHHVRRLSIKALGYLFDETRTELLLKCAWNGFSGDDERSLRQIGREQRAGRLAQIQIEAVTILAKARDFTIVASLEKLEGKLKKDSEASQSSIFDRLSDGVFQAATHRVQLVNAIRETIRIISEATEST